MASYDPQRSRARVGPVAGEPAPVDLLLGGTAERPETPHAHGPECHHDDHERADLRVVLLAGAATVVAVVAVFRRRRRRR